MSRRFIAGAVCPRCGKMDKLLVDSETEERECVSCGFSDARPTTGVAELPTRVSRAVARLVETQAATVRIMDSTPAATAPLVADAPLADKPQGED